VASSSGCGEVLIKLSILKEEEGNVGGTNYCAQSVLKHSRCESVGFDGYHDRATGVER
jgi:hypothetical protein